VITPDEFVQAGDLFIYKCPTWQWQGGDPARAASYLPKDKQFLITKNVPCPMRVESLEQSAATEHPVVTEDGEEWVHPAGPANGTEEIVDISAEVTPPPAPTPAPVAPAKGDSNDDDDEDIPDMESFEGDNLVEDDAATLKQPVVETDNILHTRTYDITLTYDKYYQTPRMWLFGYNENRQPLKPEEIFEDISEDHAHKTVTIDTHPHLGVPCAYIHPCRHAAVMKKIMQKQIEAEKIPRVDQYLFLFLKFISAVIPTIEYDFTIEMDG